MFKKIKGAMKKMQEKIETGVNTIKGLVNDPKHRVATGVAIVGIGFGLVASGMVQLRMG